MIAHTFLVIFVVFLLVSLVSSLFVGIMERRQELERRKQRRTAVPPCEAPADDEHERKGVPSQ